MSERQVRASGVDSQLYAEFPDAEIIAESRQESWDGGTLTYTMTVDFKADIAREKGG